MPRDIHTALLKKHVFAAARLSPAIFTYSLIKCILFGIYARDTLFAYIAPGFLAHIVSSVRVCIEMRSICNEEIERLSVSLWIAERYTRSISVVLLFCE